MAVGGREWREKGRRRWWPGEQEIEEKRRLRRVENEEDGDKMRIFFWFNADSN